MRVQALARPGASQSLSMFESLKLVWTLMIVSLVGLFPVLVSALWDQFRYNVAWPTELKDLMMWAPFADVDYFSREPIFLHNYTSERMIVLDVMNLPNAWVVLFGYFPMMVRFYIGPSFNIWLVWLATLLVFVLQNIAVFFGFTMIRQFSIVLSPLISFLFTRWSGSIQQREVAKYLFSHMVLLFLGTGLVVSSRPLFPESSDVATMARFCVIYPFVREMARYGASKSAWFLSQVGENNQAFWMFLGYAQLFPAVFLRMEISNLTDPTFLWILVLYQTVIEIALRVTLDWRDRQIRTLESWACFSWRVCHSSARVQSVDTIKSYDFSKLAMKDNVVRVKRRAFQARAILSEMMCEYTAIFGASATLLAYSRMIMLYAFPWYAGLEKPFEQVPETARILEWGMVQAGLEIFADCVSVWFESRNNLPLLEASRTIFDRNFAVQYMWATWYAFVLAFAAITAFRDDFENCWGRNVCACANNGLSEAGVLMKYCLHLYNETRGVPPAE